MKKIRSYVFFVIIFFVTYLFYVFPFEILNKYLLNEESNIKNSLINTVIFATLIIYYLKSHNTFAPLKFFVYEGIGVGFISFWVVCIGIILNFINIFNQFSIGIFCIILIILVSGFGFLKGRRINIKKIELFSSKLKKKYNFIFISDVHLGTNKVKHLSNILKKIKTIKYDFLLIGGDLIDSSSFKIEELSILNNIKKKIYFVNGNHEYYLKDYQEKLKKLSLYNIKVLINQSQKIKDINLIGIDDLQAVEDKIKHVKKLRKENSFNLILNHKPDIWEQINDQIDLMLTGHTHNGQIFPFNLIVKLKFKYSYGLFKKENSNLYVSSGSGCWGPKIRIGTSNEIIHFKLNSKSS